MKGNWAAKLGNPKVATGEVAKGKIPCLALLLVTRTLAWPHLKIDKKSTIREDDIVTRDRQLAFGSRCIGAEMMTIEKFYHCKSYCFRVSQVLIHSTTVRIDCACQVPQMGKEVSY
jgi:hypothetical protein